MRKIKASQILVFIALLSLAWVLGIGTTWILFGRLPSGDFRGLVLLASAVLSSYLYALLIYRIFMAWSPLAAGEIAAGSRQEFIYHVYLLFYLLLFYPVMRSGFVPVPLMRLLYQVLGARLGANTYSSGIILDPRFVEIGSNCIVGQFALIVPHVIEGSRLAHYPVRIGNNVTIGAHAVVLSDVTIGDDAIVATGAVVKKGTRIGAGEVWGGVPASLLDRADKSSLLA
ncbi:MAG: DapH/DapD/GlmU-related protein [Betaproteobacteria bacterium]